MLEKGKKKNARRHVLLSRELVLLESGHELGGETEGAQTQATLRTAANIVDESDGALVHLLLVEVLVLDHVHVDKVAHVGAGVPADVVGVDVDLPKHADHLSLVDSVGLCARSGGGRVGRGVVKVRLGGHLDHGERERVGDLEGTLGIHTDDRTGRSRRESLGAVLNDLHDHLFACILA